MLTDKQKKNKINLIGNTTAAERKKAKERIAANKKKALAKVKTKKSNVFTKRIDKINKATKG